MHLHSVLTHTMRQQQQQRLTITTTATSTTRVRRSNILFPLLLLLVLFLHPAAPRHLVINGHDAAPDRYPYFATLVSTSKTNAFCGGVVIHDDIVLSSAHCAWLAHPDGASVGSPLATDDIMEHLRVVLHPASRDAFRIDDDRDDDDDRFVRVTAVELHPDFGGRSSRDNNTVPRTDHDVLLLRVATQWPTPVAAVNRQEQRPVTGQTVTVVGYGASYAAAVNDDDEPPRRSPPPTVLQEAQLHIVAETVCESLYTELHDAAVDLCAMGAAGESACFGDSGGPLVMSSSSSSNGTDGDVLVGIVVHGPEEVEDSNATRLCGDPVWPGVFARVSGYQTWMDDFICSQSRWPPASCSDGTASGSNSPRSEEEEDASTSTITDSGSSTTTSHSASSIVEILAIVVLLATAAAHAIT